MFGKIKQLLDWVYRKNCYICRKIINEGVICNECFEEIKINELPTIKIIQGIQIHSASIYNGNLRKLIRGIKYHNQREMALPIAKILYEYWKVLDVAKEEFEIVPIPLYYKREKKRKYNHMELIAEEFGKMTGYNVNKRIVTRIKDTKPQYKLTRVQRIQNLFKAFKVDKTQYNGKNLLLIDDICTTGITLEELINCLKKENIKNLCAIVSAVPESVYLD